MPRIRVQAGGPYLVSGGVPLTRRSIVYSEHGEPMTWRTHAAPHANANTDADAGADADDGSPGGQGDVALCRCGGSANKPFCDGTHATNGFEGTEAALTSRYDDRARTYQATRVVVRDDRAICEHAGFCGNRVTNVWEMVKGDATDDSIARAQLMAMIERCPSGALTYRLEPDDVDIEPDLPYEVGITDDGPLFVTGGIPVERADGRPFETRNRVTLCRCGASDMKPLCDGSHKDAGFTDR